MRLDPELPAGAYQPEQSPPTLGTLDAARVKRVVLQQGDLAQRAGASLVVQTHKRVRPEVRKRSVVVKVVIHGIADRVAGGTQKSSPLSWKRSRALAGR